MCMTEIYSVILLCKNISELTLKMSEKPFSYNERSEIVTLLSHISRDNMCTFYLLAKYVITRSLWITPCLNKLEMVYA